MFGHRSDGKKIKHMNIIDKAEPFFMNQRIDAVNYVTVRVPCAQLDEFIQKERREGQHYSYMHIMIATIVRILYVRKKMNRFIMNGAIYQRNTISISMDIKKKLEDDGEQVTLKMFFTGRESLEEVREIVDGEIAKNIKDDEVHTTTKTVGPLVKLPDWFFRFFMSCARWADRHGMLSKKLIKASPFHTSCFLTNLKSIKLGHIYHHLYNFGTTTMFISMGKEGMEPYVENNKELKIGKFMNLGISLDERVADGLYMGKTLKLCKDLLTNPESLKVGLPDDGSIPKKMIKKKPTKVKKVKKTKKTKQTKEKKQKKIKPLINKERHSSKVKKSKENLQNIVENENK